MSATRTFPSTRSPRPQLPSPRSPQWTKIAYASSRARLAEALGISLTALDTARKDARKLIRDEIAAERRAAAEKPKLSPEEKHAEILRLAALAEGPYAIRRKAAARDIGITGRVLDSRRLRRRTDRRERQPRAIRSPSPPPSPNSPPQTAWAYPAVLDEEAARIGIDAAALNRAVRPAAAKPMPKPLMRGLPRSSASSTSSILSSSKAERHSSTRPGTMRPQSQLHRAHGIRRSQAPLSQPHGDDRPRQAGNPVAEEPPPNC